MGGVKYLFVCLRVFSLKQVLILLTVLVLSLSRRTKVLDTGIGGLIWGKRSFIYLTYVYIPS